MAPLPHGLIEKLHEGKVIPFVGAGVSRAVTDLSGQPLFPSWPELLARAVERLRADQNHKKANRAAGELEDNDYLAAAKTARDGLGADWFPFLNSQFDLDLTRAREDSLAAAKAVWQLGSQLVITTNYDRVLHFAQPHTRYWTFNDRAALANPITTSPTVWHLHGIIDHPEHLILTPAGYQLLYPDSQIQAAHEAARSTLRHLLTQRTFLFIGFGMEQALKDQIQWVRDTYAGAGGHHYVLVTEANQAAMQAPDPECANYDATNLKRVSPVGLFPRGSTPEGIADLAGNVWEWSADWFDSSEESRSQRGGSWTNYVTGLRAAYRYSYQPGNRYVNLGFRCARDVPSA